MAEPTPTETRQGEINERALYVEEAKALAADASQTAASAILDGMRAERSVTATRVRIEVRLAMSAAAETHGHVRNVLEWTEQSEYDQSEALDEARTYHERTVAHAKAVEAAADASTLEDAHNAANAVLGNSFEILVAQTGGFTPPATRRAREGR